jgi:hypothetical protein
MLTPKPKARRKIGCNERRSSENGRCPVPDRTFRTLGEMVQDYIHSEESRAARKELAAIARLSSLERAIGIGALGQMCDGRRSIHHYRRSKESLNAGKKHSS